MTKGDLARNRWNQSLNPVVQTKSIAVDLDSCLSHMPHPIFQVFKIYPKYDFSLPSLLPPHLMIELVHLSFFFFLTSFYFPCFHLLPVTLASLKFISVPGMFLFWGSCCSCSLCMQWSQLDIHLQTPLRPQVIAQISFLNKDSWTIQMKTTLYLSPRALPILISCFMFFFQSTYLVSNIYMIYLIIFNACHLPVTLGRDLCVFYSQTQPKCLKNIGHTVGAK